MCIYRHCLAREKHSWFAVVFSVLLKSHPCCITEQIGSKNYFDIYRATDLRKLSYSTETLSESQMRDPNVFARKEITKIIFMYLEGKPGAHALQSALQSCRGNALSVKEWTSFQTSFPSSEAGDWQYIYINSAGNCKCEVKWNIYDVIASATYV